MTNLPTSHEVQRALAQYLDAAASGEVVRFKRRSVTFQLTKVIPSPLKSKEEV